MPNAVQIITHRGDRPHACNHHTFMVRAFKMGGFWRSIYTHLSVYPSVTRVCWTFAFVGKNERNRKLLMFSHGVNKRSQYLEFGKFIDASKLRFSPILPQKQINFAKSLIFRVCVVNVGHSLMPFIEIKPPLNKKTVLCFVDRGIKFLSVIYFRNWCNH